jgi:hypothetical protein
MDGADLDMPGCPPPTDKEDGYEDFLLIAPSADLVSVQFAAACGIPGRRASPSGAFFLEPAVDAGTVDAGGGSDVLAALDMVLAYKVDERGIPLWVGTTPASEEVWTVDRVTVSLGATVARLREDVEERKDRVGKLGGAMSPLVFGTVPLTARVGGCRARAAGGSMDAPLLGATSRASAGTASAAAWTVLASAADVSVDFVSVAFVGSNGEGAFARGSGAKRRGVPKRDNNPGVLSGDTPRLVCCRAGVSMVVVPGREMVIGDPSVDER